MTRFAPVSEGELAEVSMKARSRISGDLLQEFLDTEHSVAKLDRGGIPSSLASLQSSLRSYIQSHGVPVKLIVRGQNIYFVRTDRGEEDTVAPTPTKKLVLSEED